MTISIEKRRVHSQDSYMAVSCFPLSWGGTCSTFNFIDYLTKENTNGCFLQISLASRGDMTWLLGWVQTIYRREKVVTACQILFEQNIQKENKMKILT